MSQIRLHSSVLSLVVLLASGSVLQADGDGNSGETDTSVGGFPVAARKPAEVDFPPAGPSHAEQVALQDSKPKQEDDESAADGDGRPSRRGARGADGDDRSSRRGRRRGGDRRGGHSGDRAEQGDSDSRHRGHSWRSGRGRHWSSRHRGAWLRGRFGHGRGFGGHPWFAHRGFGGFGPGRGPFGPRSFGFRMDPERMFDRLDADNDGSISKEEFKSAHERFRTRRRGHREHGRHEHGRHAHGDHEHGNPGSRGHHGRANIEQEIRDLKEAVAELKALVESVK